MELGFNLGYLVFLHEEKVAIELVRHVIVLVITHLGEVAKHTGQRISAGPNQVADELVVGRICFRQSQERLGHLPDVVVGLDVNIRFPIVEVGEVSHDAAFRLPIEFVKGAAPEIIQTDAETERYRQENARDDDRRATPGSRKKGGKRAKHEEERPADADNAPWGFVFHDTISDQGADAVNRQVTQSNVPEELAGHT